jgi:hypothetical protein
MTRPLSILVLALFYSCSVPKQVHMPPKPPKVPAEIVHGGDGFSCLPK